MIFYFLFTTITEDLLAAEITVNTEDLLAETCLTLGQLGLEEREIVPSINIFIHKLFNQDQSYLSPL